MAANERPGIWLLLRQSAREWWEDDTFRYSAALAFYTIFSLAPILLIAVGIASLFLSRETAVDRIVSEMQGLVGHQGARAMRQILESSSGIGRGIWAIATGIVTFLIGATAVFGELQSALNKIWDVQSAPRRGLILKLLFDRLRSFAIAFSVGFLLLVSLVVSAVITALRDYLNDWMPGMPWLWQTLNITISFAAVMLLFALIYKYLPDARISWENVWVGSAVTALLFSGGKYLIGLYLGQTAIGSAFGAAGSFAVLLVWVYYTALVCFFGAEFTEVYARNRNRSIEPEEHAVRVGHKPDPPSAAA